jgi:SAM-dependent methyltransferase
MRNEITEKPIALDAYEALAEAYAERIETKPHNAYYERPATLSLLPDVRGKSVLDAGCGPGVYAEWLIDNGAEVVALDVSEKMVSLAKLRLGGRAVVLQADLDKPLPFPQDVGLFDLVLCPLVLAYLKDLRRAFGEFYRVLRRPGSLVFSVDHPFSEYLYSKCQNYFETELVGGEWGGFGLKVYVPCLRRPLSALLNPLIEAGFAIDRILEPQPIEEFKRADPKEYEKLNFPF